MTIYSCWKYFLFLLFNPSHRKVYSRPAVSFDLQVNYIWMVFIYRCRLSSWLALQLSIMLFSENNLIKLTKPPRHRGFQLFLATLELKMGETDSGHQLGEQFQTTLRKSLSIFWVILLCLVLFSAVFQNSTFIKRNTWMTLPLQQKSLHSLM